MRAGVSEVRGDGIGWMGEDPGRLRRGRVGFGLVGRGKRGGRREERENGGREKEGVGVGI